MKTIIISDLHLTHLFDQKKFNLLTKLIGSADKLIINGDFWDAFITPFDKFISSSWSALFPLMLEKKTIYLYGNHDLKPYCDQRVSLFSVSQCMSIELKVGSSTYLIEHGHNLIRRKFCKNQIHANMIRSSGLGRLLNKPFELKLYQSLNLKSLHQIFGFLNNKGKKICKKITKEGKYFVMGHTHLPELEGNLGYINTGFIGKNRYSYLEITAQGPKIITGQY